MSTETPDISQPESLPPQPAVVEPPFGVNEMRLSARQWLATFAIVLAFMVIVPLAWRKFETFPTGTDYRMPYGLSRDYWLFDRRLDEVADRKNVLVFGDSVVWGEYVRPDGTLSHFLDEQTGQPGRFVNCGVNGLFPLALEGLLKDFGPAAHGRKVILQCNVLWMSNVKADLSDPREQTINHSRLIPQFTPRIPSYHADAAERISAQIERQSNYFAWTAHLQTAYYDQRSIAQWTLKEDGSNPPGYPNAWRNPLSPLKAGIPTGPANDPERGPTGPRHKPWTAGGGEPTYFEWVDLDASLQWQAFQRLTRLLRDRGNDVLVIVGPFNEHMIAADQRPIYQSLRSRIAAWLASENVTVIVPETLPSDLYADASHPLTDGYALLAKRIFADEAFRKWKDR